MTKLNNNNNSIIFRKFSFCKIHLPKIPHSAKYTFPSEADTSGFPRHRNLFIPLQIFTHNFSQILFFIYCFQFIATHIVPYSAWQLLYPMCIILHLSTLNSICQSTDHSTKFFKSLRKLSISSWELTIYTLYICVWSANFDILHATDSSMSLI